MKKAIIIVLAAVVLLVACSNPSNNEEKAVFVINLGGGSAASRVVYPPPNSSGFPGLNDLEFIVTFTPRSGGSNIIINKRPNNSNVISDTITPGDYSVTLDINVIYLKKDNTTQDKLPYASGGAWDPGTSTSLPSVTIDAGVTNNIDVKVNFLEGTGISADPFRVYDQATLERIGQPTPTPGSDPTWTQNWALSSEYILLTNVTLSGTWTPIGPGSGSNAFSGVFDGNGKTITGLSIPSGTASYYGLFGCVDGNGSTTGIVKDLNLANVFINVTGGGSEAGGVVGRISGGAVKDCSVTLTSSSILGSQKIGGVVGYNLGGTVENCSITGTGAGGVQGLQSVGGIVGQNENGTVDTCSSDVHVSSTSSTNVYAGGVVGHNLSATAPSTVKDCHAAGIVNCGADNYVGGVVGYNHSTGTSASTVQDCYATGNVTGGSCVGGVVGGSEGSVINLVKNCYATGNVTSTNSTSESIGGVAGRNNGGTIESCYYEAAATGVSGIKNVGGVVGVNYVNTAVPSTVTKCYAKGNVTGDGNYIGGVVGLNQKLGGTATATATVEYCYYAMGTVTGTGTGGGLQSVGGVVGCNYVNNTSNSSTVINCYATGNVNASNYYSVGGVVGNNQGVSGSCTVISCYATGNVTGNGSVGGVVGNNTITSGSASVEKCVALNSLLTYTASNVGRVIGQNAGSMSDNYAWVSMTNNPATPWGTPGTGNIDGDDVSPGQYEDQDFWDIAVTTTPTGPEWDFISDWKWGGTLPILRNVGGY